MKGGAKRLGLRALLRRFRNRLNLLPLQKAPEHRLSPRPLRDILCHQTLASDCWGIAKQVLI